jgi:hypothetical protein
MGNLKGHAPNATAPCPYTSIRRSARKMAL